MRILKQDITNKVNKLNETYSVFLSPCVCKNFKSNDNNDYLFMGLSQNKCYKSGNLGYTVFTFVETKFSDNIFDVYFNNRAETRKREFSGELFDYFCSILKNK